MEQKEETLWDVYRKMTPMEWVKMIVGCLIVIFIAWVFICIIGSAFNPYYGGPNKP